MTRIIENRTFDEISVGETASLTRQIRQQEVELFAALSGDINPAHLDADYAASTLFKEPIAHGMLCGALVSTVLGTQLPGPGTIYVSQELRFRRPVKIGDTLTVTLTCREKQEGKNRVIFDCDCKNQDGESVTRGVAEVIAPTEKVHRNAIPLPTISLKNEPYAP